MRGGVYAKKQSKKAFCDMIVCRSHVKKSQRHEFLTRDNADFGI